MGAQETIERIAHELRHLALPLDVAHRTIRRAVEVEAGGAPWKEVELGLVRVQQLCERSGSAAGDVPEDRLDQRAGFLDDPQQGLVGLSVEAELEDQSGIGCGLRIVRICGVEGGQRREVDQIGAPERLADGAVRGRRIAERHDHGPHVGQAVRLEARLDGDHVLLRRRAGGLEHHVEPARVGADMGHDAGGAAGDLDAGLGQQDLEDFGDLLHGEVGAEAAMRSGAEHQVGIDPASRLETIRRDERPVIAQRREGRHHDDRPGFDSLAGDGGGARREAPLAGKQRRVEARRLEQQVAQGLAMPVGGRRIALTMALGGRGRLDRLLQQAAPHQLFQHLARAQEVGRDQAGHRADHHGADLVVRDRGAVLVPELDQPIDDAVARQGMGAGDGTVDEVADALGTVHGQPARFQVAERIGEDQGGDADRAVEEGVRFVEVEPEILAAGLGQDAAKKVGHDVDPAARVPQKRRGEVARPLEDARRVGLAHDRVEEGALPVVGRAIEAQGEIRAAGETAHLRAEGHLEMLAIQQHLTDVGVT